MRSITSPVPRTVLIRPVGSTTSRTIDCISRYSLWVIGPLLLAAATADVRSFGRAVGGYSSVVVVVVLVVVATTDAAVASSAAVVPAIPSRSLPPPAAAVVDSVPFSSPSRDDLARSSSWPLGGGATPRSFSCRTPRRRRRRRFLDFFRPPDDGDDGGGDVDDDDDDDEEEEEV